MLVLQMTLLQKLKVKPQIRRKYLQNIYLTKDLYLEYINNSYNSVIKRETTQLFNNGQKT